MTRAALYARVSTSSQDASMQVDDLVRVAAQRGWTVAGTYVDEGVSGGRRDRPQLDRMLQDCREGRLDVVAVWKLDRLGRSLPHLVSVVDELRSLGVGFASVRDPGMDTTTPAGALLFHLLAAFAEFERDLIRERTAAGVARARAAGKRIGRPPALVDVERVRELRAEGRSWRAIARELGVSREALQRRIVASPDP